MGLNYLVFYNNKVFFLCLDDVTVFLRENLFSNLFFSLLPV